MDIFTDATTTGLRRAAEINLMEKSLSFCAVHGARQGGPNPRWFITGSPLPGYNGIVHASFHPTDVDEEIGAALRPFVECGLPLTWWVGPSSAPSTLGVRLQAHGLVHTRDVIGMSAVIDNLAAPDDYNLPALNVEEVASEQGMPAWKSLYSEGFKSAPAALQTSIAMLCAVSFKSTSLWRHYLVRRAERVIAIASLFFGGGVAGLYNLVTATSERGQGIGSALTLQVFAIARQMGFQIATLQTTHPDALRLYHRLGFEAYCKFSAYQKLRYP